mgnify:CR=1 FL=1
MKDVLVVKEGAGSFSERFSKGLEELWGGECKRAGYRGLIWSRRQSVSGCIVICSPLLILYPFMISLGSLIPRPSPTWIIFTSFFN